ncbi:MAG: FtsW/RodA/SpoVE family cell cycle protein [Phycisphaerae bacterium]|nr:FtsW/RodA/SpoVE family cell cycle protein [Phycisphaerae bacterium]
MTGWLKGLRRVPWVLLAMVVLLCLIGQASMDDDRGHKQLVWLAVSLAAMGVAAAVPYRRLGDWSYVIFGVSLALLVAVFVLPEAVSPNIKGARRWIRIPNLPEVNCQPSELAKIAYILMIAWYLRYRKNYRSLSGLLVPFALTLVPLALVLKEPDLGTSMLFLPTLFAMLFLAGANVRHLLTIIALGVVLVVVVVFWQIYLPRIYPPAGRFKPLEAHQEVRIRVWLNQGSYTNATERDEGYQIRQGLMCGGSGGLVGRRGEDAVFTRYNLLPEDDTDFIFSLIGHRWGFVGCFVLLAAYMVIFAAGVEIAAATPDPFGRLLAVGVTALFAAQMAINTGMAIGLLPVTGMTLPFVSYGGSSLVVNFAALGLLINIRRYRPIVLYKRRFEWDETLDELT